MENRQNVLRGMEICRFCLCEDKPLTNIYERQIKDGNNIKQQTPLPLQLMACVAIEVFENDGMPQMICNSCRSHTIQAYKFKTDCKKADDALKFYLATGNLIKPLNQDEINQPQTTKNEIQTKTAIKRNAETLEGSSKAKKHKNPPEEEVSLHDNEEYAIDNNSNDNNIDETGDSFENNTQNSETYEETYIERDDDSFMNLEDESVLNPTLKVNQVKTDVFPCPHCDRSFPLKQLLDLHVSNHNRERNFNCDECDKAFFTKYDLSKHLLTHTGCKPYTCVVCQKSFSRESLLHRHEKVHIDAPKYLCSECDRTFLTGEDLDAHAAKHKKKRPYACKICQKSFVFKQGLERHEISHTNVKPHKCNYCEASFTSAIKLTRHVTSHAGLRPYPCKICGRTFLLSHHLTRHMRSHYAAQQSADPTGISPIGQHKCDICSMSFKRKDSLINHSAIHSMVNLKCVICNTEFDNVAKVKEHITTHLSDLPYPCEKCDYSFETQEQLEDHELKHAEMEYEEQIEQEVIAEAKKAAEHPENDDDIYDEDDEDNSDYSGGDIAEFTITNIDNPEVVRRSKRITKVKNYAEFLQNELGSDLEDDNNTEENADEEKPQRRQQVNEEIEQNETETQLQDDEIKPIVRSEGTKVYTRKNLNERPKIIPQVNLPSQVTTAPLSKITQQPSINTTIEQLRTKDISKLPDKEIFNMKLGDKTVTVQKLVLTKEQMKAMAREGKIEKKGNTFLLKKTPGKTFQTVSMSSLMANQKTSTPIIKSQMKKTYERKSMNTNTVENGNNNTSSASINFDVSEITNNE